MKKLLIVLFALSCVLLPLTACNYSANDIEIKFIVDGNILYSEKIAYGDCVSAPEPDSKDGYIFKGWYTSEDYTGKWNFDDRLKKDTSFYGYWTSIDNEQFDVLFFDGDTIIKNEKVNKGEKLLSSPPQLKDSYGYKFVGWFNGEKQFDVNEPICGDMSFIAKYEPIRYSIKFVCDGETLSEQFFTVENMNVAEPEIPVKEHYFSEWENFDYYHGDIIVNAVYIPKVYTATFIIDGEIIKTTEYTVEDTLIPPPIPVRTGYEAVWKGLPENGGNVKITAQYIPIEYTVRYFCDGKVISTQNFNINTVKDVVMPQVPEKAGYKGRWNVDELPLENITLHAEYELIFYTVTFIADGIIIGTEKISVIDMSLTEPPVPAKEGFIGFWKEYKLELNDITVEAFYIPE